jgi:flagellar basal body-associated protein FliL
MTCLIVFAWLVTPAEAAAKRGISWVLIGIVLGVLAALVVGAIHYFQERKKTP